MVSKEVADEIKRIVEGIQDDPENFKRLLEIGKAGPELHLLVAKSAIHFSNLGDERKQKKLKNLILKLYQQELEQPDLVKFGSVLGTMVMCLHSYEERAGLTERKIELYENRQKIVEEIFWEMTEKADIGMLRVSLAVMQDEGVRKRENAAFYFEMLIERGIESCSEGLIGFVGPLLASTGSMNPEFIKTAERFLEILCEKNLGKGSPETMKEFGSIMSRVMCDPSRRIFVRRVVDKIISENKNELIYLVGPLVAALKDDCPRVRKTAREILEKIERKKLGRGDEETVANTGRIFGAAVRNPASTEIVLRLIEKLEREECIRIGVNRNYEMPKWKRRISRRSRRNRFKAMRTS